MSQVDRGVTKMNTFVVMLLLALWLNGERVAIATSGQRLTMPLEEWSN